MSQEQLALAIGRTKSVISRIEAGRTSLDLEIAQQIADTLNATLADVLGISTGGKPLSGFAEDVTPYDAAGPQYPALPPNQFRYLVATAACENAGVKPGDIVVIDDSAAAVGTVQSLDIVVVAYHHPQTPNKAAHLLRQFVPPSLLITNSGHDNARSIDVAREDASIMGVVVSIHKKTRNGGA